MQPQTVNTKLNRMMLRSKVVKASILAAIAFSAVMMTGYRGFEKTVFITDNGVTKEIKTNESDIYEILENENYGITEEDRVTYTENDKGEGHITVTRAFETPIWVDGDYKRVMSIGGTVSELLEKANVKLGEFDEVVPAPDTVVTEDTSIEVIRIRYSTRKKEDVIPFETEYVDDPDLAMGYNEVLVEGENGVVVTEYKDKFINGKIVESVKTNVTTTKEPVTEVIEQGTALSTPYNRNTPDYVKLENGVPTEYTRIVSGKSTAYSAAPGARTASGRYAEIGTVAVNPNVIPYGSELYIMSSDGTVYGYAIAADTGLGMMDGSVAVDVFMGSYADSCRWGVHYVDIYVLSEGSGR